MRILPFLPPARRLPVVAAAEDARVALRARLPSSSFGVAMDAGEPTRDPECGSATRAAARLEARGEDGRHVPRRRMAIRPRSSRRHLRSEVASVPVVLRRPWREKPRDSLPRVLGSDSPVRASEPGAASTACERRLRSHARQTHRRHRRRARWRPRRRGGDAPRSRRRARASAVSRVYRDSSFSLAQGDADRSTAPPPLLASLALLSSLHRGSTSRLVGATRSSTARRPSPRTCTCASS